MQFCKKICISVLFLATMITNPAIAGDSEVSILNIDEFGKQHMEVEPVASTTDSYLHSENDLATINTIGASSKRLELESYAMTILPTDKSIEYQKYNAGNTGRYIVNRTNINQIILIAGNIAKYETCDVYGEAEFSYGTLIPFSVIKRIITVCRHSLNSIERILSHCKNYLNNINIQYHFESVLKWGKDFVTGKFEGNHYYDDYNHIWKKLDKSATEDEIDALDIAIID